MAEPQTTTMSYLRRRMDGMSMSSSPMFRTRDSKLARTYWYIIAAIMGFALLWRGLEHYQTWSRIRVCRTRKSIKYPTRVNTFPMQVYATCTAVLRETNYPQLHLSGRFSWLSPPPLGRCIVLCCYWAVIVYMMTYKAIVHDANYYERLGFRNAWIGVTQVPLVYLLATKSSIVGFVIGSSHERLNWLHRWVSRTLLLTVTIHGGFFLTEWVRADFVKLELDAMPMVKYGLGAWGVLVWTFISSLSPLRRAAYELFVLQHIAAAGVFLWLLHVHVPAYAQYNIWFAIAAISSDWILRGILMILKNFRAFPKKACNGRQRVGHEIETEAIGNDLTIVTIKDVHMSWKAGQHLYLWLPYLGALESHPFTIASPFTARAECHCNEIQLAIRAHSGFSKRIHNFAKINQGTAQNSLTGFITGPYGAPPRWEAFETLILISASTGASFTLPILESLLEIPISICIQRIFFLLVVRDRPCSQYYEHRLSKALARAEARGIDVEIEIAVTGRASSLAESEGKSKDVQVLDDIVLEEKRGSSDGNSEVCQKKDSPYVLVQTELSTRSRSSFAKLSSSLPPSTKASKSCSSCSDESGTSCCAGPSTPPLQRKAREITYSYARPSIAPFIRSPVEMTGGETAVVVCGGKSLVSTVRNEVVRLSDDRGVHKGTGAQGIFLHVEEYCF
ncbi:ferric-chelate reductase [Diplocarpon rosae]|nr:ferric-chelate reductase [Diplocarpon rosae]